MRPNAPPHVYGAFYGFRFPRYILLLFILVIHVTPSIEFLYTSCMRSRQRATRRPVVGYYKTNPVFVPFPVSPEERP